MKRKEEKNWHQVKIIICIMSPALSGCATLAFSYLKSLGWCNNTTESAFSCSAGIYIKIKVLGDIWGNFIIL